MKTESISVELMKNIKLVFEDQSKKESEKLLLVTMMLEGYRDITLGEAEEVILKPFIYDPPPPAAIVAAVSRICSLKSILPQV